MACVHDALRSRVRQAEGRSAELAAGIDSQRIRTADTFWLAPAGLTRVRRSWAASRSSSPTLSACY